MNYYNEFDPKAAAWLRQLIRELANIVRKLPQKSASFVMQNHPLSKGVSGRVGLLRGYGNAIVPQVAAEFIKACREVIL